jgi:hypothetical protein
MAALEQLCYYVIDIRSDPQGSGNRARDANGALRAEMLSMCRSNLSSETVKSLDRLEPPVTDVIGGFLFLPS